jgi:hypothetical protein
MKAGEKPSSAIRCRQGGAEDDDANETDRQACERMRGRPSAEGAGATAVAGVMVLDMGEP